MSKPTLETRLRECGARFDCVRKASKLPKYSSPSEKPTTHVVRLSMVYKGKRDYNIGQYDYMKLRDSLESALEGVRGVTVLAWAFKEYYGRRGYWGVRGSYIPAQVTNWTISIYVNWKGD